MMALRPQTLYGLTDSPVFLAAFMLDHDPASHETDHPRFVDGHQGGLSRDDVLDNITHVLADEDGGLRLPACTASPSWQLRRVKNVTVPVAVSVFPDEVFHAPRSWTEQAYPNLIHYNEVDRGGHFAAWEQPELYASELRDGFARFATMTVSERAHMRSFAGATEWLNSEPLGPAELRGRVVSRTGCARPA